MWMLHKAKPLPFVHVAAAAKKGEVRGLSPILSFCNGRCLHCRAAKRTGFARQAVLRADASIRPYIARLKGSLVQRGLREAVGDCPVYLASRLAPQSHNPSVSLSADSSLCTREPFSRAI